MSANKFIRLKVLWSVVLAISIVCFGTYALRLGGRIVVKSDSVEISSPVRDVRMASDAARKATIQQNAYVSGHTAHAINSLGAVSVGDVQTGKATVPAVHTGQIAVSQEAEANGKNSTAINAIGDVTTK